ncbi:MAG: alpha/beta hydrolase [Halioglobus sp.]
MAREYWYFVGGALAVLVPLLLFVAVKKLHLLEIRPDREIVYTAKGQAPLTLHAFTAQHRRDDTPTPALLLFHGGRWLYGGPEELYPQCAYFAQQGYACFSAQYRLGADNRPDVRGAVADARAALDYLLDNAQALGIDPARIAVGGGSAGGHLAAALGSGLPLAPGAATPDQRRPAAQVLYNPMLDLAPGTPDHHLVREYWEAVSPLHHVDNAVPPALILVGSQDPEVPLATVEHYCAALRNAGGRCDVALYDGQSHGFYHNPAYREQTNRRILAFLQTLPNEGWAAGRHGTGLNPDPVPPAPPP